jgi:biopolymer transport protein TolR
MRVALPRADINVTPMIDVMLVLLIIFMVVVPVIVARVTLPVATNSQSKPDEPDEIVLSIERSGALWLETTGGAPGATATAAHEVSAEALNEQLSALYRGRTRDRILFIKADTAVAFGVLDRLMGIARDAGVRMLAAVVEQRRTQPGM